MFVKMSVNMAANQYFYVGQKAFIEKDGKLLLMIDPRYGLDLPGGRIQEGETDIQTSLIRELKEETNLTVKIGKPFTTWIWNFPTEERKGNPLIFLIGYKCKYVSGELKLSAEHSEYFWVSKDDYRTKIGKYWDESNVCRAIGIYFN